MTWETAIGEQERKLLDVTFFEWYNCRLDDTPLTFTALSDYLDQFWMGRDLSAIGLTPANLANLRDRLRQLTEEEQDEMLAWYSGHH